MSAEPTAVVAGEATEALWAFEEANEWEGEEWRVYFSAGAEHREALEALAEFLGRDEDIPYDLYEVEEIPEEFDSGVPEDCEYSEPGEEDCGDCAYCGGSEGYYPPESEGQLNHEKLPLALSYWALDFADQDGEDPLYKLGLFSFDS